MADIREIAARLINLTVKEAKELGEILEKEYGLKIATSGIVPAAVPTAQPAEVVEKTQFDVVLREIGPTKLNLIKTLKEMTGLGLTEAKVLLDGVEKGPVKIKENISKDEALALQSALKGAGAEVDVK